MKLLPIIKEVVNAVKYEVNSSLRERKKTPTSYLEQPEILDIIQQSNEVNALFLLIDIYSNNNQAKEIQA